MLHKGRILSVSRKKVELLLEDGALALGVLTPKALDACVGDIALYQKRGEDLLVTKLEEASQVIKRSYRGKASRVGANINRLFVVTAIGEVFNPRAIDRVLVAAHAADIPVTLVFNKSDLGKRAIDIPVNLYTELGFDILICSAFSGEGLSDLEKIIKNSECKILAFVGVSGVGKSSLIKAVLKRSDIKVREISDRTGQGRQTTSQARGYLRKDGKIIVDFPGVQLFGLTHISQEELIEAFPEFHTYRGKCRFSNCAHIKEEECGVKEALENGSIIPWRYASYLEISSEIEEAKPY